MFLYVPSEKHGGRGMACVSLSAVRPAGAAIPAATEDGAHQWAPSQFEALTTTRLYDPEVDGEQTYAAQCKYYNTQTTYYTNTITYQHRITQT